MPVIAIASPKGGCGKTTTSLVLSTTLAEMGASVTVFDCDRNKPISKRWLRPENLPPEVEWKPVSNLPLTVKRHIDEETIIDVIDEARTKTQFVICDLEGTGSLLMSRAIGRSQFVIIPLQPSDLDADEAGKALALLQTEEKNFGRRIAHRVLWTRTPVVAKSKLERDILAKLERANVPTFTAQLHERAPFKAIMRGKCGLSELLREIPHLVDAESIQKAQTNARALTNELLGLMAPKKEAVA